MDAQPDLAGALERLLRHVLGAPGYVLEQLPMRVLDAEEVVAAVGRGSEDSAITRLRQHPCRLDEKGRRHRGAVGVEHDRAGMTAREQLLDRAEQAVSEIGMPSLQQS